LRVSHQSSVDIDAMPSTVWAVYTDVERWPEWNPAVSEVTVPSGGGGVEVGSRVRIKQPRLRAMEWVVVERTVDEGFTWTTSSGGVTTVAGHRLTPRGGAGTRVTVSVAHSGFLAPVVRLLFGRLTRRYLQMEMIGLARRCQDSEHLR